MTSPVYFVHGGRWKIVPDQKIDVNAVMRTCIEFDSGQDILEGTLVYRIQRQHTKFAKSTHYGLRCFQLLVAWHVKHTEGLHVRAVLIEHDKELDEDKLRRLHQKCWHPLNVLVNPVKSNWILNDVTALATTIKVMNGGYRWDVFVSEKIKDNAEKPLWVDTKR
jgi:hypothetical protein